MTIKAYDGTTWQTQKSLKIFNGASWSNAKQAWIFNGANWSINYPESPQNLSGPTISTTSGISGRIGCVYLVSVGSWNGDDAYIPTSYSYQWTRSGTNISGATNNTYTTGADDVDKVIGCRVTATNLRGSTPATATTGIQMLPQITSFSATNITAAVSAPSVTFNTSNLNYSGSWTSVLNATTYETIAGGTAGTPSVDIASRFFSGTGTAGTASFSVRAVNTTRKIRLSWGAAVGASTYDIYVSGSPYTTVVGTVTTFDYDAPDDSPRNFAVYPRTSGNIQGYGQSTASPVAAPATYSGYGSGSGTLVVPNATSPTYASASASTSQLYVSWGGATNATKYRVYWNSSGSFSGDPTVSYDTETTGTAAAFYSSYTEGATYYFWISASGDNNVWTPYGSYKASAAVAYTAPGTPSPSTNSVTYNSFSISWAGISGASFYSVKVGTSYGGSNTVNTTTTSTSYSVSGLSASTTYYVTIAAYKDGYGYGGEGTTSATTTQNPTTTINAPNVQFERTASQIKWGIDNGFFSGPFTPYGIEWEVRTSPGGGTLITGGNTISYTTTMNKGPVNGYLWNYWVRSTTDLAYSASARYLRARMYGYNEVTFQFVDGAWSGWV